MQILRFTDFLIGLDGGGSKTAALVADLDGHILGRGTAGPSNYHAVGVDAAYAALDAAIHVALADIEGHPIAICVGMAGAGRAKDCAIFQAWAEARYPGTPTTIVHDGQLALAAGTPEGWGIAVLCGTGSLVYGEDQHGKTARAGGWGYLLGDEGSGYAIGRNAVTAALKDHDGSGSPTLLKEMILGHLGLGDVEEIIDWAYDPGREPRHFAYLVPLVKEAENRGDSVAASIMEDAGTQLGHVTQAVIRRLGMEEFPVVCSGGVFKQPNGYNRAFERTVREVAERCVFMEPMFTPTVGSALLAMRSLGVEISDDLLVNVEKSIVV